MIDAVVMFYALVMGLCVGSFLNVVIYRLPLGQSLVSPGSRCTTRATEAPAHDRTRARRRKLTGRGLPGGPRRWLASQWVTK